MANAPLVERVERFLKSLKWSYNYDAEEEVFYTGCALDESFRSCNLVIDVQDDMVLCYAFLPIEVPADRRGDVMIFLTCANWGMRAGTFELDLTDGEVRFRTYVACPEGEELPTDEVLTCLLSVPPSMIERYGAALRDVIENKTDPFAAVSMAERDMEFVDDDDEDEEDDEGDLGGNHNPRAHA